MVVMDGDYSDEHESEDDEEKEEEWEGLGGKIEKDGYEQGLVNELVLDRRLMLCV